MRAYWILLIGFIFFALASVIIINNLKELVDEKDAEIQQLKNDKEILRGFHSACIIENSPKFTIDNIMAAFTVWTPMTAAEIEYWREEENRG